MDKGAKKSLLGWEPVYSRIIRARVFSSMQRPPLFNVMHPPNKLQKGRKIHSINLSKSRSTKHHYVMSLL